MRSRLQPHPHWAHPARDGSPARERSVQRHAPWLLSSVPRQACPSALHLEADRLDVRIDALIQKRALSKTNLSPSHRIAKSRIAGQAHGTVVESQQLSLKGATGGGSAPINVHTSVLYNPDLQSSYNIVPGLIAMILFQTATSLTALAIVKERERGTIEQLIVTPIRNWELILAKIIPYILVSFADTILILVVGTLLFGVPIRGSLILLFALTGLVPAAHTRLWTRDLHRRPDPAAGSIDGHACHAAGDDAVGLHISDRVAAACPSICGISTAHHLFHLHNAGCRH